MDNDFFIRPILNSPYDYPGRHWELVNGQPTQHIVEKRRTVDFITPIPKPRKVRSKDQQSMVFDEGHGLSTDKQQYRTADTINRLREEINGGASPTRPTGRSHPKLPASSSTGAITISAGFVLSSASLRLSRPPSG